MDNVSIFDNSMMNSLNESSKALLKMGSAVSDCLNKMRMDMESIHVGVQDELERFRDACQYISLESIDNDVWRENRQSMEQWGKYGWTAPPQIALSEMYDVPENQVLADEYMKQYYTDNFIKELISEIHDIDRCNLSVFQEAVSCYLDEYYVACASLLFSLIDGVMSDFGNSLSARDSRVFGDKAIKKLEEMQEDESEMMKTINMYSNTLACLQTMFKSKNMNVASHVINRNQLLHGVLRRDVTKMDCFRIFLVYWHVLWMIKDLSMYN